MNGRTAGSQLLAASKAHRKFSLLLALALLLTGCRGFPALGGTPPTPTVPRPSETELAWNEVEARLAPATALIRFELPQAGPFLATGIAYAPGLLLTIAPPLEGGAPQSVQVLLPGSSEPRPAELRGVSPCDGVAVVALQPTTDLALAPLAGASETDIGIDVLVYGHSASDPDGAPVSAPAVIAGVTTDTRRAIEEIGVTIDLSGFTYGSLLVNRHAAVLGLLLPTGLFLPAERARAAADVLAEGRGLLWLGLGLSPHRNPQRFGTDRGLVVLRVTPNGPAASAGIEPGMLLTHVDGTELESFAQLCGVLRQHRQGDELTIELRQVTGQELIVTQARPRIGESAQAPLTELRREPRPRPATTPVTTTWTFDRPEEAADWPTGSSQAGTGELRDGSYVITLNQPNAFGIFPPLSLGAGTDQRITARVSLPENAGAGLIVRSSQEPNGSRNLYLCAVVRTGGQLVATCSLAVAGQSAVLLPVTPLAAIDPATDPLELELAAQDTRLLFRVAGETVAELDDPLLGYGQVALWVESFDTVPVTVRFHEVHVELLPR